jgi:hypothetical protein
VPEHLERRATGPDDHRRARVHELRDALAQQAGDLVAGAQVRRRGRVPEAPEVDHALDAGVLGRLAEVDRGLAVARREVAAAAFHRVDEVDRAAAARERVGEPGSGHDVAAASVDIGRELRGVAGERPDGQRAPSQLGENVGADVAGGAGEEDRIGHRMQVRTARAPGLDPCWCWPRSQERRSPLSPNELCNLW